MALVVKALGADGGEEAGEHVDLVEGPDIAVAEDDVATLDDEVFVISRVVKALHDVQCRSGRRSPTPRRGTTGAGTRRVGVMVSHRIGNNCGR